MALLTSSLSGSEVLCADEEMRLHRANSRSLHFASPPRYAKDARSRDLDFASAGMTILKRWEGRLESQMISVFAVCVLLQAGKRQG